MEFLEVIKNIPTILRGWFAAIFYKLGFLNEDLIKSYEQKNKKCNKSCPLYVSAMVDYCNPKKLSISRHGTVEFGCGCFTTAKKFTNESCPLGHF